ncbi:hypothetical protein COD72_20725 [Bacillus cereus]|nr:hypothetical protein COD72_20725 [Bacillus cereus]
MFENQAKEKFDKGLPCEGLLVWRIDKSKEQEGSVHPGMLLIQAGGNNDLLDPNDGNDGDPGDPFPGTSNIIQLSNTGRISTSFSKSPSGVSLKNISYHQETK